MRNYIIVEADVNDGDYITKITEISNDQLKDLRELLAKTERMKMYNGKTIPQISWGTGEMGNLDNQHPELTNEDKDYLNSLCPHGEYGTHTITEIRFLEVTNEEKLL